MYFLLGIVVLSLIVAGCQLCNSRGLDTNRYAFLAALWLSTHPGRVYTEIEVKPPCYGQYLATLRRKLPGQTVRFCVIRGGIRVWVEDF